MNPSSWVDKLLIPMLSLLVNAAITYGVITTQLQWIRSDIERQQRQIEKLEDRIFRGAGSKQSKDAIQSKALMPGKVLIKFGNDFIKLSS